MFNIISYMSVNNDWLLTANLLLSFLLLLWLLRFRILYKINRKKAEQQSRSLEDLNEGFYRAKINGQIIKINSAMIRMSGLDNVNTSLEKTNQQAENWYLLPGRRHEFTKLLLANGFVRNFVSEVKNFKTGKTLWVSENAHLVSVHSNGKPTLYEGSVLDISDAVQRTKLEDRLDKLSKNLPGGLFQLKCDKDGNYSVPYMSYGFYELMGLSRENISDPSEYLNKIHPDHIEKYIKSLAHSLHRLTRWTVDFRLKKPDGEECWMGIVATPERLEDGSTILHGHINDISERKDVEGKIAYYAYYDPLTRLPNRTFFMHQLKRAISSSGRSGIFGAILFLDIDDFKQLNDTLGHAKGDMMLQEVAHRLKSIVRDSDVVSRFGGDEFVILLDSTGECKDLATENATLVANKIIAEFDRGFSLGGEHKNYSPSIGISVFNGENGDSETLINHADIAMYDTKKQGKNSFTVFDNDKSAVVASQNNLKSRLKTAIQNDELEIHYQAQVDQNGGIYGTEALVRWRHPDLGMLNPGEFIPLAEQSGFICELNNYVLGKAIEHMAKWRKQGCDHNLRLAINISPQQLRQTSFVSILLNSAQLNKVPINCITLEVKEYSMARDFETTSTRMQEIRQLGAKISLDDFGTGYSSLSQLNELPFDEVKIDGSFISNLEENSASRSMVEAIIAMAGALQLDVVAEHVNSNYQERFLLARGCKKFQGFNYSHVLPEEEFFELISNHTSIEISG